jgi:NDP-sugar pyrophosphorylase family protein
LKAIILCAGYGKRLFPYTKTIQKTMLPLHGKPALEYIICGLIKAGIRDFILVVGYQKEQIINYFKNGEDWEINIEYVEQDILNGTGGALLLCEPLIKSHFVLTWGDTLLDYRIYAEIVTLFKRESYDFILTTNYTEDPHLGAAVYTEGDYCIKIIEKPPKGKSKSNLNNTGLFILPKQIFEIIEIIEPSKRGEIELPEAISKGIKDKNWKVRILRMDDTQFRGDIGKKFEYEQLLNDKTWLEFLKFK